MAGSKGGICPIEFSEERFTMTFMHYYTLKDDQYGYEFAYYIYEQNCDIAIAQGCARNLQELLQIENKYNVAAFNCMDIF
jgi:hypothetical protein